MRIKNSSYIKNTKKTVAVAMSMMMAGSLAACGSSDSASVIDSADVQASSEEDEMTEVIEKSLGLGTETDAEVDKEETVYLISDANGEIQDTIVDEWLKNPEGKDEIKDVSKLTDIENVKGDETFSQEGTKLTWQAGGSDIYYQGHTSEVAPVSVKATYYLDGKEIAPEDIAGKKGHVKIRYEYQNTAKNGDIYTPFIMATGMTLGMEDFVNVTAENAKVISDGSRYIVVGYGMPGLTESLGLDEEDIQLPDYFEVEADTDDFKLGMTITVASVETLGEEDIDIKDAEKEINDLAGEYQDGMNSLVEGVSEYTNGVDKVNEGVNKLSTGSEVLYSGAGTLKNGMDSAASGTEDIKDGLDSAYSGSKSISDGASELNEAVQGIELPDVTKMAGGEVDDETKASIKSTAEASLGTDTSSKISGAVMTTVATNAPTLASLSGLSSEEQTSKVTGMAITEAAKQDTSAVLDPSTGTTIAAAESAISSGVEANVKSAVKNALDGSMSGVQSDITSQVSTQVTSGIQSAASSDAAMAIVRQLMASGMSQEDAKAMVSNLLGTVGSNVSTNLQNVSVNIDTKTVSSDMASTVASSVSESVNPVILGAYQSGYGTGYGTGFGKAAGEMQAVTSAMADPSGTFSSAVTDVASAYASAGSQVTLGKVGDAMDGFSTKLDTLKAGTATLASGTSQLTNGLSQLDTGAGTLEDGMTQLKSGTDTLYSGTKTLNDGVGTLKTGTNTLSSNSGALNDGATQLQDATDLIVDKLNEKEDGINQFVDNVNSVKAAARDYQSFGGASGDMTSKTKFIIKVDGIDKSVK